MDIFGHWGHYSANHKSLTCVFCHLQWEEPRLVCPLAGLDWFMQLKISASGMARSSSSNTVIKTRVLPICQALLVPCLGSMGCPLACTLWIEVPRTEDMPLSHQCLTPAKPITKASTSIMLGGLSLYRKSSCPGWTLAVPLISLRSLSIFHVIDSTLSPKDPLFLPPAIMTFSSVPAAGVQP